MKAFYDSEVDAPYIKFNDLKPEGVVEVEEKDYETADVGGKE